MKALNITLRVVLGLLTFSPILGSLNIFPAPTPDLYNTAEAYTFIMALYSVGYMTHLIAVTFALSFVLIIMNRMALAALIILPVMVNIVAFHLFLDGGLLNSGAIMADVLALITLYFLWQNRQHYVSLYNAR